MYVQDMEKKKLKRDVSGFVTSFLLVLQSIWFGFLAALQASPAVRTASARGEPEETTTENGPVSGLPLPEVSQRKRPQRMDLCQDCL